MGANKKQSSYKFSVFNMLKSRRPRRVEDIGAGEATSARKEWRSDGDKGRCVADPRINTKASAFIAHFHATRVSESERYFQA